jgi:hypothetical protein
MTNNKQQTAVEWFIEQLEEKAFKESVQGANRIHIVIDVNIYLALKQQAKEMEKEQIEQAKLDAKEIIIIKHTEHGGGEQ